MRHVIKITQNEIHEADFTDTKIIICTSHTKSKFIFTNECHTFVSPTFGKKCFGSGTELTGRI